MFSENKWGQFHQYSQNPLFLFPYLIQVEVGLTLPCQKEYIGSFDTRNPLLDLE